METYEINAGDGHPLSKDEQLIKWLNTLPDVEARNTTGISVTLHQTTIRQFARDAEDGKILLELVEDATAPNGTRSQPVAAEPVVVDTPHWLFDQAVMWHAKMEDSTKTQVAGAEGGSDGAE